jgi:hypothetical protein
MAKVISRSGKEVTVEAAVRLERGKGEKGKRGKGEKG